MQRLQSYLRVVLNSKSSPPSRILNCRISESISLSIIPDQGTKLKILPSFIPAHPTVIKIPTFLPYVCTSTFSLPNTYLTIIVSNFRATTTTAMAILFTATKMATVVTRTTVTATATVIVMTMVMLVVIAMTTAM